MDYCGWVSRRAPIKAARFRVSLGAPSPEGHKIIPSCYPHNTVRPTGALLLWMIVRRARHRAVGEMAWHIAALLKSFLSHSVQGLLPIGVIDPSTVLGVHTFSRSRNNHLTRFLEGECHPCRRFYSVGKVQKMKMVVACTACIQSDRRFVLLVSLFSPQAKTRWRRMATQFQLRRRI